ncbi:retrovirus-related pol polyprotein from transposon TNT 1-94 [Tanacetum coccineum]
MANLSEDIQCAGSDTRPPMLDKADFVSWQQRIRLYCRGKDNGINILKSIDEGPFRDGDTRGIIEEGTEGPINLGPERPRVYSELSQEEKDRYNADIRATNIILQGLPKDIYSLINHYIDAKDIWDNVKMLLEGSELTKEDRESQLYDDFEHFRQNKGETIHSYYVRFAKLINDMRNIKMDNVKNSAWNSKQHEAHANENKMMLERLTQQTVDPLALMSNVSHQPTEDRVTVHGEQERWLWESTKQRGNANPGQARQVKCYNCNGLGHIARNCTQTQACPRNSEYFKDKMLLMQAQENRVILDEEQSLFLAGGLDNAIDEDVDEQPVQDLALNVDNVFQADDCDCAHDHYQDAVCDHHEEHEMHDDVRPNHVVDSHVIYTSDSNMTSYDQYVKDNAVPVIQNNASMVPNDAYVMIDNDLHDSDAHHVRQNPLSGYLKVELSKFTLMISVSFQNKPSSSVNDTPDFNSVFVIGQMKASLQGKDNVIQKLKMQISQFQETHSELERPLVLGSDFQISQLTEEVYSLQEQNELFRAENAKIKQHYKELYDSIKITRAKHTEQTSALKSENERKYALDVEPIPPRNRNNREVHLVYLRHLKESVDTLRDIVEEAKAERPLDSSLEFACRYTKHSQELLEYVFGTCPKVFNQQDKKHATTPRKKQIAFEDQIATSSSTTHKHVEPRYTQKSNVPVPPSTGVSCCTDASGSQPRSISRNIWFRPAMSKTA